MAKTKTNKPERTGGLSVRTFGGLNEKNFTKGVGLGDRLKFEKPGKPYPVQFVADIDDDVQWVEFWQHQFNEGGWKYVPCLEENCPLCEDESEKIRARKYRFVTNVYSFLDKKIVILEGPKDISSRVARRRESAEKKKSGLFLKRVYDLTQNATSPVSYDVEVNDERKATTIDLKDCHDLRKYIDSSAERYFGGSPAASKKSKAKKGKSALDAEDKETQEDSYSPKDLAEMSEKKISKVAKSFGIDSTDVPVEKLIKKIVKAQK